MIDDDIRPRPRCPECFRRDAIASDFVPSCNGDGTYVRGCCGHLVFCRFCDFMPYYNRELEIPRRILGRRLRIERAARKRGRRQAKRAA